MRLSLLVIGLLLTRVLAAQPLSDFDSYTENPIEKKSFNDDEYQKAVEGLDYYEPPSEQEETRQRSRPKSTFFSGIPMIVKGIGFLLIIGLIAFLIYKLIGSDLELESKKVKRKDQFGVEDLEKHLHDVDLSGFLKEAVANENYRLAIRIHYLILLRYLSEADLIQWTIDKTNREYMYEMRPTQYSQAFRRLTRVFEQTWYGDFPVSATMYHAVEEEFNTLLDQLPINTRARA